MVANAMAVKIVVKNNTAGKRGQLGIEFFLILSVSIAFAIVLYNAVSEESAEAKVANQVIATKASLESLASAVDLVVLSGDGSVVKRSLLVPSKSICFYYDSGKQQFFCVVYDEHLFDDVGDDSDKTNVYSKTLVKDITVGTKCTEPLAPGWWQVTVKNNLGIVDLSCSGPT